MRVAVLWVISVRDDAVSRVTACLAVPCRRCPRSLSALGGQFARTYDMVIACDLSADRVHMARHNCGVYGVEGVFVVCRRMR